MPIIKSVSVRSTVARSIAYILNPDKTNDLLYTTSLNCMTNARDAYLNMKMVYENYSVKKFNEPVPEKGKGRVKAIHYIQNFDPQDNISPELAHRIGKAFALKAFGENCQVVIATHTDKSHIHNHLILNTYSMTGEKFNDNLITRKKLREISDRVCLAFGIQPIPEKNGYSKSVHYNEWEHKQKGTSWKQHIRDEIDMLIGKAKNFDELLCTLEEMGYEVKRGKYISIRAEDQQRFVRFKTLGDEYAEESIIERICWKEVTPDEMPKPNHTEFSMMYCKRIYEVGELIRDNRKIRRKYIPQKPYSINNDYEVYRMALQLSVINRERISSIGELEGKLSKAKAEYDETRQKLNSLMNKQKQLGKTIEQCEEYFALKDKTDLSPAEELKLKMCSQIAERFNVIDADNVTSIVNLKMSVDEQIVQLNKKFTELEKQYFTYKDIADTYYKISKGDYISNLIEEKRKQDEQEVQKSAEKKRSKGR